ncbi:hypothetical protein ACFVUY_15630 [Kitasatospora sp. NPDC058063]|uniref:hypothetical protein n=1 Tax=unclassified Kitasatospora TaxID=2633591 RepID=UPI0036DA959F
MYRILFAEFVSGEVWGELPAAELSYTRILSAPGSAAVKLSFERFPWQALAPWRVLIYVQRGQQVLWSGPLVGYDVDLEAETVTLSAVGLWEYYRRRQITSTATYSQLDQGLIARRLVEDYADGTGAISWNTGPAALSWDGSEVTGVPRDRTYHAYERKFVGPVVEDLGAVRGGFGFRIDSGWLGGRLTNTVRFLPRDGEPTDLVLDHGSTCDVPRVTVDGTAMTTEAAVTGSGDGESQMVSWWYNLPAETDPSRRIPRLSSVESRQDVVDPGTLTEYARQTIAAGSAPITIPSVRLYPGDHPGPGDVQVGHQVRVRVPISGRSLVDGRYLVTEITVRVGDDGEETTLTLTPTEVYANVGSAATPQP